MIRVSSLRVLLVALGAILLDMGPLVAQATELGRQSLGRPYWHLFAAYAIVVLLIAGWVISIARRLGRIEQRLPDVDG
ncbi:MAG: CcmD family protein [Longimicrobiales bacterium]